MEGLNKSLARLPIVLVAALYIGYLAYDYYDWLGSAESELGKRKANVVTAKAEVDALKKKLTEGEQFFKTLDAMRSRIRQVSALLESAKGSLSAEVDIANFVRMVTLEAKKLGLTIKGIKPESEKKQEYYVEIPFTVSFRGAYVQVLVFLDRVAKFQQVIRVSDFQMKPSGNNMTKYVELDGSAQLTAYKYLGTAADENAKKAETAGLDNNAPKKKEGQ